MLDKKDPVPTTDYLNGTSIQKGNLDSEKTEIVKGDLSLLRQIPSSNNSYVSDNFDDDNQFSDLNETNLKNKTNKKEVKQTDKTIKIKKDHGKETSNDIKKTKTKAENDFKLYLEECELFFKSSFTNIKGLYEVLDRIYHKRLKRKFYKITKSCFKRVNIVANDIAQAFKNESSKSKNSSSIIDLENRISKISNEIDSIFNQNRYKYEKLLAHVQDLDHEIRRLCTIDETIDKQIEEIIEKKEDMVLEIVEEEYIYQIERERRNYSNSSDIIRRYNQIY